MTIYGEPVAEVDIGASYLTLFHAWHGEQLSLDRDPYDIPDLPREVVKAWLTATFGSTAHALAGGHGD